MPHLLKAVVRASANTVQSTRRVTLEPVQAGAQQLHTANDEAAGQITRSLRPAAAPPICTRTMGAPVYKSSINKDPNLVNVLGQVAASRLPLPRLAAVRGRGSGDA